MTMSVSLKTKDLTDYLNFLKDVHVSHICEEDEIYLKNAIRRYETLWIPLMRSYSSRNESFRPPLDVHWMWHLHFHNPHAYKKDLEISGDILDHVYFGGNMDETKEIWKREYPLEPYEAPCDHEKIECFLKNFVSSFSYDLIEASKRQSGFYYQVSMPHYRNDQFQRECIERYEKFLKLKSLYPTEFVVPFFDIDLAWHTHMSKPILYAKETSEILGGKMLDHNDRVNKGTLKDSHEKTSLLWKEVYSENYEISGVVHRGDSPNGRLLDIPSEVKSEFFFKKVNRKMKLDPAIYFTNQDSSRAPEYELDLKVSEINAYGTKILLEINNIVSSETTDEDTFLFLVEHEHIFSVGIYSSVLIELEVNVRKTHNKLCMFVFGTESKLLSNYNHQLNPFFGDEEMKMCLNLSDGVNLKLNFENVPNEQLENALGYKILNTLPGSYNDCMVTENIESLWGPIPLKKNSFGQDDNCNVVVHTIIDTKDDSRVFNVHLVNSLNLGMSCVQVSYGENIMSIAHLIGPETLSISHINEFNMFNNSPWRAMIIKDNQGDWGILIGHWIGVTKPTKSQGPSALHLRGISAEPGRPGYFRFSYMNLRSNKTLNFELPDKSNSVFGNEEFSFHIPNKVSVNMRNGDMLFHSDIGDEIIQHTTLCFAVSVLYLMVLPAPDDIDIPKCQQVPDKYQPLYFKSKDKKFCVLSGIQNIKQMPTNSTFYHYKKNWKTPTYTRPYYTYHNDRYYDNNEYFSCDVDILDSFLYDENGKIVKQISDFGDSSDKSNFGVNDCGDEEAGENGNSHGEKSNSEDNNNEGKKDRNDSTEQRGIINSNDDNSAEGGTASSNNDNTAEGCTTSSNNDNTAQEGTTSNYDDSAVAANSTNDSGGGDFSFSGGSDCGGGGSNCGGGSDCGGGD